MLFSGALFRVPADRATLVVLVCSCVPGIVLDRLHTGGGVVPVRFGVTSVGIMCGCRT